MCCLKYEQDYYEETLKKLPKVGKEVLTPDGVGNIVEINVLRERVKVKLRLSDDTFDVREYPIDDVKRVEGKAFSRPEPKKPESAPQKEKAKEAAKGLNHANGFIKHEVNARIKMRRIPDFHFIADDSTEYSAGIAKILNSLEIKQDEDEVEDEE